MLFCQFQFPKAIKKHIINCSRVTPKRFKDQGNKVLDGQNWSNMSGEKNSQSKSTGGGCINHRVRQFPSYGQ